MSYPLIHTWLLLRTQELYFTQTHPHQPTHTVSTKDFHKGHASYFTAVNTHEDHLVVKAYAAQ